MSGRALTALAGLIANAMIARLLPPGDVGSYFLIVSLVSVAVIAAQLGLQRAVVRLVAEAMSHGLSGRARAIVTAVLRIGAVSAFIVGLTVGLGGRQIAERVFDSSQMADVMWFAAMWIVISALLGLLAESFRGFHDIRLATVFTNLVSNLLLAVMLAIVFKLLARSNLRSVLSLSLAAGFFSLLLAGWAMRRKFSQLEASGKISFEGVVRIGLPLMISSLAIFVVTQADLWIIGAFLAQEDVAIYGAAVRLVQLVAVPLMIINAILPPFISELYSQGKNKQLENVIRVSSTIAGAPAIVVLLAFMVASDMILGLVYGDYYRIADTSLMILSMGQLINVWTGSGAIVLMMTGHQTAMMAISVLFGGALVICDLLIVNQYGVNGVALVSGVITALQALFILFWVKYKTGMWTHGGFANMSHVVRLMLRSVPGSKRQVE